MEPIKALFSIDYPSFFITGISFFIGLKAVTSILEWLFIEKLKIETGWTRKKEEHNLLIQTSNAVLELQKNFVELQKRHLDDMRRSDEHDEKICNDIKALKDIFIEKEIDDMRWEINNFANKIVDGKRCNKDSYKHCIKTYEKYEKILHDNNLENGEVEISMEFINDSYKEKLIKGF